MGWAKYYEDNMSIINNRLPLTYIEKKEHMIPEHPPVNEVIKATHTSKRSRAELEIHFRETVDHASARKLQINGWWWSKLNNCWCNYNTTINRAFAEQLRHKIKTINIAA